MTALGHSRQIVGRRKSFHVRNAPKATTGRQSVARREGPLADVSNRNKFVGNVAGTYYFLFASGFATLRACSMKSFATGLSVRFLRVTIPTGTRGNASSTGKTLSSARLA